MRERLVSQRTGIINRIRALMLERGIAVRQGIGFLRTELPTILATRTDVLCQCTSVSGWMIVRTVRIDGNQR